jgi:hypothetical protein
VGRLGIWGREVASHVVCGKKVDGLGWIRVV